MSVQQRVAGAWSAAGTPYVNVGGTWVLASEVYQNIAGVWTKVWPDGPVLPDPTANTATAQLFADYIETENLVASITFDNTGNVTTGGMGNDYNWLKTGIPADFEIKADLVSGSIASSSSVGIWLPLTTSRSWKRTLAGQAQLNVQIRRAYDQVLVAGPVQIQLYRTNTTGGTSTL